MDDLVRSIWRALSRMVKALFRLGMAVILLASVALAGLGLVKGSQPVGALDVDTNSQISGLYETSYLEFIS